MLGLHDKALKRLEPDDAKVSSPVLRGRSKVETPSLLPDLGKLKAKIEKLQIQQHQLEEKYISAVEHLIKDLMQKGFDLPILTGMLLNASDILNQAANSNQKEVWQTAGQKFLHRAKHQHTQRKRAAHKT